jgi:hypothetical protein
MWHSDIRVNRIDMVVLSTRYNLLREHSSGWNREVKCAGGGVLWGWVTDREVWPRLKFDQRLSVISAKNILIERLASQTIQRFKKTEKKIKLFKKIYKLCRRGYAAGKAIGIDYAESSSYADDQIELRRGLLAVDISWNSCSDVHELCTPTTVVFYTDTTVQYYFIPEFIVWRGRINAKYLARPRELLGYLESYV